MFREYIALNHPVKKNRTNLTGNRIGQNDRKGYHKFTGSCTAFEPGGLSCTLDVVRVPFDFHSYGVCVHIIIMWRSAMPARN